MAEQTSDTKQTQIYKRRWWTVVVLSLSVFIVALDVTVLNIALPTLQRELGATQSELQWMVAAYVLAVAALVLTMGALGDRLGRAHLWRVGMVVFAAGALVAMFANSAGQVILARVAMGIGGAPIMCLSLAIIANVFPREERGKAIGVWTAMGGISIALGPIISGLLLEHFSWHAIFFINIPVVVVALIAGQFLVPNSRDPHPQRLDLPGMLLSGSALSALVFGLIKAGDWGWADPNVIATLVGAVAIGVLFVVWERRTTAPMLPMRFFRNPRFSTGVGSTGTMMLSLLGLFFGLTLYLQFVLGYSALETGIRFVPIACGFAIGAITCHQTMARFGTNRIIGAGFLGVAAFCAGASFWQVDTSFWILGPMFFVLTFAASHIMIPALDSIVGAVPEARAGIASSTNSTSLNAGQAIGVAAFGSVLSAVYTSKVTPLLAEVPGLPPELVHAAQDSVGAAMTIAGKLPAGAGDALAVAAGKSFMDGWQVMTLVACGIAVIAAGLVFKFMPPRHLPQEEVE